MTIYGFNDRDVAVGLRQLYETKGWKEQTFGLEGSENGTLGYLFMTPTGGIPARSGNTCGSAECLAKYIDPSGEIKQYIDSDGANVVIQVYNPFSSAVGGDRYITAKRVFGQIVVDAEDCQ